MSKTHNILHVAMPLELLPCKEACLVARLGVVDPASAPNNGPVERQHSRSLKELHSISILIMTAIYLGRHQKHFT